MCYFNLRHHIYCKTLQNTEVHLNWKSRKDQKEADPRAQPLPALERGFTKGAFSCADDALRAALSHRSLRLSPDAHHYWCGQDASTADIWARFSLRVELQEPLPTVRSWVHVADSNTVRKKFCLNQKAELLGQTSLQVECVVIALHPLRWA